MYFIWVNNELILIPITRNQRVLVMKVVGAANVFLLYGAQSLLLSTLKIEIWEKWNCNSLGIA